MADRRAPALSQSRACASRCAARELFTVKLDGGGLKQITPDGMDFNFCNGNWSPQGNEIVFSAHIPNGDYHSSIWVVHFDGSGLRQIPVPGCGGLISDPTIGCFNPVWSPDGRKIAFGRNADDEQRDIYTVNADGSDLFQVTHTPTSANSTGTGARTRSRRRDSW